MSKPNHYELLTLEEQYFLCKFYQDSLLRSKIGKKLSSIYNVTPALDLKIRNQVVEAYNYSRITKGFQDHGVVVLHEFMKTTSQTYRKAIIRDRNAQIKITD